MNLWQSLDCWYVGWVSEGENSVVTPRHLVCANNTYLKPQT